jgi:hypothetical protein
MISYEMSAANNQTIAVVEQRADARSLSAAKRRHDMTSDREAEANSIPDLQSTWTPPGSTEGNRPLEESYARRAGSAVADLRGDVSKVQERFRTRLQKWKDDTKAISSTSQLVIHPEYQKIIGMGWQAVPLILDELKRSPTWLFWALVAIVDEDPVKDEDRGNLNAMAEAWIRWGASRGITSSQGRYHRRSS